METQLPPTGSSYGTDRRVFPNGWAERLIRTQYSRFYNQAVLGHLEDAGQKRCFVPRSKSQDDGSKCSIDFAGRAHDVSELRQNMASAYAEGKFVEGMKKIPEHPHCTHVVRPID